MAKDQPRTAGWGICPLCGLEDQPFKVTGKEHLYFICPAEADGGCNHQSFARGPASDRNLAQRITRWKSKEERAKWLDNAPEPEPEPEPEDDQDEPPPADDPPPPPKPKRRAASPTPPAKPKRPQPPQLVKPKTKKLLGGLLEW